MSDQRPTRVASYIVTFTTTGEISYNELSLTFLLQLQTLEQSYPHINHCIAE